MTLAELIAIIGAVKSLVDIATELKAQGLKPTDRIPEEHMTRVRWALSSVQDSVWDETHGGEGG